MVTFCLHEEDHTLGNVLRWMCMKESVPIMLSFNLAILLAD
jgi:DNA-directed RNA polymerase subunit L